MNVKPREEVEKLGFDVIYIEPKEIEKYNACYRVEYLSLASKFCIKRTLKNAEHSHG